MLGNSQTSARFILDENLSPKQAALLREQGYDAVAVAEVGLSGTSDETVRAFAIANGRILITLDADSPIFFVSPRQAPPV